MYGRIINKYRLRSANTLEELIFPKCQMFISNLKENITNEVKNKIFKNEIDDIINSGVFAKNSDIYSLLLKHQSEIKELIKNYYEYVPDYEFLESIDDAVEQSKYRSYYELINGKIYQKWEYGLPQQSIIQDEIDKLQKELYDEDYKIIKCYEYSLSRKSLPYDINMLNDDRDQKRNRISELKTMLIESGPISIQRK